MIRKFLIFLSILLLSGCLTYRTHSKSLLNQIDKNPSRYTGQLFAFNGRVIQASETNNKIVFQMIAQDYSDDFGGGSITIVYESGNTSIARDHDVKVLGKIGNVIEGKNLFGGTVSSITMHAIAVWDTTAGKVFWLKAHDDTYRKWKSGELFSPTK